jgi:hypothetical protein
MPYRYDPDGDGADEARELAAEDRAARRRLFSPIDPRDPDYIDPPEGDDDDCED